MFKYFTVAILIGLSSLRTMAMSDFIQTVKAYLPFEYVDSTSCYSRNEYMVMELAAAGIPSTSINISSCTLDRKSNDRLTARTGRNWLFHVAPVIEIEGNPTVLDPYFSDSPMRISDWITKSNVASVPATITFQNYRTPSYEFLFAGCGNVGDYKLPRIRLFLEEELFASCSALANDFQNLSQNQISSNGKLSFFFQRSYALYTKLVKKRLMLPKDGALSFEDFQVRCQNGY